jgi:CDP-paratose 2-epimerase
MRCAARGQPITIYGDGKQVRDVLYVEDLVRAFRLAVEKIDATAGEVFNIGGGPARTLSVWSEFGDLIARFKGNHVPVSYDEWRAGDQPCYVSDIRKADRVMDWSPSVEMEAGIEFLWEWIATLGRTVPPTPAPELPVREAVVT